MQNRGLKLIDPYRSWLAMHCQRKRGAPHEAPRFPTPQGLRLARAARLRDVLSSGALLALHDVEFHDFAYG